MRKLPNVGVGVIIKRDGKILLGKRKNAHGDGSWSFPGGHLEFNEDPKDCAEREVMEEVGINIKNMKTGPYTNDVFKKENKHYITLYILAELDSGEPEVLEPDKCERWEWFSWNNLPSPLFIPIQNLLKQGYDPFKE